MSSEIPPLDLPDLMELIRSPQKAVELWDKYEEARAAYEAQQAAIEAAGAELKEKELNFLDQLGAFGKDTEDFTRDRMRLEAQHKQDKLAQGQWEVLKKDSEAAQNYKAAQLSALNDNLEKVKVNLINFENVLKDKEAAFQNKFAEDQEVLAKREAAVAAREAKAEALTKLLKAV